ncbi:MAG: hypothetical protein KGJ02_08320, partial [Verrucomicrobiota bacterium]|nr:hypothetical protein [Verrucomicrobiota bacterium]
MALLLLFLALFTSLSANTIVTENDPASLVEGVSVITGDLYTFEEDYVVQGAEPIHIKRAYISSEGDWSPYPHFIATLNVVSGRFWVVEPNGTRLSYQIASEHKKKEPLRFNLTPGQEMLGLSNTSSGEISARTNLKNQSLLVDPNHEAFTVFAADGTKRYYRAFKHQKKTDLGFGQKGYLLYHYGLEWEELPNGHRVDYRRGKQNELQEVITSSPRGRRYASVTLPSWDSKKPPAEYRISGSDGRSLLYEGKYLNPKKQKYWALESVACPDVPNQTFARKLKTIQFGNSKKKTQPYLETISFPKGRTFHVDYEEVQNQETRRHRVKTLSSPVGVDEKLLVTHSFFYHSDRKSSHVLDAERNKTAYLWNDDFRLVRIDSFVGETTLHHFETFDWNGSQLRSKTLFDEKGAPIFSRALEYDEWGNVKSETICGNLTGKEEKEKSVRTTSYTQDGRHLPIRQEEPSGLVTLYDYVPNTNLLKSKCLCDGEQVKIRTTYEYDEDLVLMREEHDDGISRTIKQITPYLEGRFFGMPRIVEEKYSDGSKE